MKKNSESRGISPEDHTGHLEIDGPAFFAELIKNLMTKVGAKEIGLLLVPQEGKGAGIPVSFKLPGVDAETHMFENRLLRALEQSEKLDLTSFSKASPDPLWIVPVTGKFDNPIGYIWCSGNIEKHFQSLCLEADFIATVIENSKKSRLHEVVSNRIVPDRGLKELYESVANMVKDGLYCEMVIVWAEEDKIFRSYGEEGWDIVSSNTLVRRAYQGETISVRSIQDSDEKIHYRDRLVDKGINSFFLIPVESDADSDDDNTICIIGVFYKRVGGNTKVDFELTSYVVEYFKNVWSLIRTNQSMKSKLVYFSEILGFHEKAVSCMVSFHEIKSIFQVLETQVESASILTASESNISPFLDVALQKIKRGEYLLEEHAETFATAGTLDESLSFPEGERVEKIALREYLRTYLTGYVNRAQSQGVTLSFNIETAPETVRVDLDHVDLVIDNLLTNAFNALEFLQQGKKTVNVVVRRDGQWLEFKVKDNGVGIEKSLLKHVFSANVTTRRREGGRGIGLAIIWKIGSSYGRAPEVKSSWGHGATFRCWVKPKNIF